MTSTEAKINKVDPHNPLLDVADFFEMAGKPDNVPSAANERDPIEDLTVFFENAMSWACTKTLKGPARTFWLFTQLPGEIRIMIWEACIPSQIHLASENVYDSGEGNRIQLIIHALDDIRFDETIDYVLNVRAHYQWRYGRPAPRDLVRRFSSNWDPDLAPRPHHSRDCQPFPTTFHQKLPFIARIDREARDVALSHINRHITRCHNLALIHMDIKEEGERIGESPVWVHVKTDSVLMTDLYLDPEDHPDTTILQVNDGTTYIKTDRLLGIVDRNMIKTAIFVEWLSRLPPPTYRRLTSGQHVQVVVGVLQFLDISDQQAGLTDLFGLFGEENMALIPVKKSSLLRKLFNAHSTLDACYSEEYLEWAISDHYFDLPRHPTDFDQYKAWLQSFAKCRMNIAKTTYCNVSMEPRVLGSLGFS